MNFFALRFQLACALSLVYSHVILFIPLLMQCCAFQDLFLLLDCEHLKDKN